MSETKSFCKSVNLTDFIGSGILGTIIIGMAVWINQMSVRVSVLEKTQISEEKLRCILKEELSDIKVIIVRHEDELRRHNNRIIKLESK